MPPAISDADTSKDVVIKEGNTVELKCSATGVPEPEITWYKRHEDIKRRCPIGNTKQPSAGGSLIIESTSSVLLKISEHTPLLRWEYATLKNWQVCIRRIPAYTPENDAGINWNWVFLIMKQWCFYVNKNYIRLTFNRTREISRWQTRKFSYYFQRAVIFGPRFPA